MESPSDLAKRLCYSVRVLAPFLRLIRRTGIVPSEVLAPLEALDPDDRMPIATVHDLLLSGVALTGDADLGLKAARELMRGEYGAVEYMARSAETWGAALNLVGRYLRLISDGLLVNVEVEGSHAFVHLDSRVDMPRAAVDFQSGAFMISGWDYCDNPKYKDTEIWFTHSKPERLDEYNQTFRSCRLRFNAPFNGIVLPAPLLDEPIGKFDPKLHTLIRQHADMLMADLPRAESLTERVREAIGKQLRGGKATLPLVARRLHMSQATLARKLEREGTSFQDVLDDFRRRLAERYIASSELSLAEIALLLGFSQSAAFHRAFKRWTSLTPLEYRRSARQSPPH